MSNARNLARLIVDSGGDVDVSSLGNVPPSNDASALTTGTLPVGRLPSSGVDASSLTTGTLPKARLSAGSVIQVVHGILDYPVVFNAPTWTDIGLSATITPTSTTSKILVIVHIQVGGNSLSYDAGIALVRNGTHLGTPPNAGNRNSCFMPANSRSQTQHETASISNSLLDAPASTSTLTYKLQGYSANSQSQFINRSSSDDNAVTDSRHISNITLMEISG